MLYRSDVNADLCLSLNSDIPGACGYNLNHCSCLTCAFDKYSHSRWHPSCLNVVTLSFLTDLH